MKDLVACSYDPLYYDQFAIHTFQELGAPHGLILNLILLRTPSTPLVMPYNLSCPTTKQK